MKLIEIENQIENRFKLVMKLMKLMKLMKNDKITKSITWRSNS